MKNTQLLVFALITTFLLNACKNLSDPGEINFRNSAFINLRTGSQKQKFFIYNSLPLEYEFINNSPGMSYGALAEEAFSMDMRILISSDNFQYDRFYIEGGDSLYFRKYYTNINELLILANTDYNITIMSGKNIITGEVKTVSNFNILDIYRTDSNGKSYLVKWGKAQNARYYRVIVTKFYTEILPPVGQLKGTTEENYLFDPDTVMGNKPYIQKVTITGEFDSAKIGIEACDVNMYNYYIRKIKKCNINNAYGYIGSSAIVERTVR